MSAGKNLRKIFFTLAIAFFILQQSEAQTLIINEVSNGASGNQEYVELVVVDNTVAYDCSSSVPPCIDIRGWIFDDNSGYHGAFGVATGAVRFSFDPLWSCVPLGTIIVIYNSADPNSSLPPDDISLSDGNCTIIVPINSSLFEQNSTTPGAVACSYPASGWVSGGSWNNTVFANGGDCARIVDLSGCEVFSVCWADANSNNQIYFTSGGTGSDNLWFFNDTDPYNQVNWTEGCADATTCGSNQQTPGAPNNAANQAYISQFNNNCTPITPVLVTASSTDLTSCSCDGTASAIASGSIPGYTYAWYDSVFTSTGATSDNITGLCAGIYHVIATSSIGCSDTATIVINPSPTTPVATVPADTIVCNGSNVNASFFTSSPPGSTFSWSNSDTSIGLAASGTGNIASFTAVNSNSSPVTATISVTPELAGCAGNPSVYTITVNPSPTTSAPVSISACAGDSVAAITLTSNPAGATFSWVNSDASIGLTGSGTGNIPSFAALNSGSSVVTSNITVTPSLNGCTGTPEVFSITIHPSPVAIVPLNITECSGATVPAGLYTSNPAGATFSWINSDSTIGLAASGNGNAPAFTAVNSGITATISVIPTLDGCTGTIENYTITINPVPVMNSVADITECAGTTVPGGSFSSNPPGSLFNWSNSDTAVGISSSGSGNLPSFTAGNPGNTSVTSIVTVTPILNGCTGPSDDFYITIHPVPLINTPANLSVCANDSLPVISLTSSVSGSDISWNNSDADIGLSSSGTGDIPAFIAFNSDSSSISSTIVISASANGCAGSASSFTITVLPLPDVIVSSGQSVCQGDTVPGSAFASIPAGATFSWTNSNTGIGLGSPGTGNQPMFIASSTGTLQTGTITVTPVLNGCTGTPQSYTITVNTAFDASINPAGPYCESGSPVNLSAIDPGGSWSGTGITNSSTGTFDPVVAGSGSHLIEYLIQGSCGDTSSVIIDVITEADATIVPAGPFCSSGTAVNFIANEAGGIWSGTGITDTVNGIFDPSVSGAGNFNITYSIGGMCGDSQTTVITVLNGADATVNPVNPFCSEDSPVTLAAANPGGVWSGSGITGSSSGTFDPSLAGAGAHTIQYIIPGTCADTGTILINVYLQSNATINANGPFCMLDDTVALSSLNPGGAWSGSGIVNASSGIFSPSLAGPGTHLITYSISGVCGDSQSISIQVTGQNDATINPAGPFCENDSSFILSPVSPGGAWSGTGITGSTTGTFDPSMAGAGNHIVTYITPGNCGDTSAIILQVNAVPPVDFSADNYSGCAPLIVNFTNLSSSQGASSSWNFDNGLSSSDTLNTSSVFNSPGCYDITLTITASSGCSGSQTFFDFICVEENPAADFSFSPMDAGILNPVVNFVNLSTGADIYFWDFGEAGTSSLTHPSIEFPGSEQDTFTVCLTAINTLGCSDTACREVIIHGEFFLYVPNSFTPDNDGFNDIFLPYITGSESGTYEFMIFDRWGELIFETNTPDEGWNGYSRGMMSKQDVYVWKIRAKSAFTNEQKVFYGHVSLLR